MRDITRTDHKLAIYLAFATVGVLIFYRSYGLIVALAMLAQLALGALIADLQTEASATDDE